MDSSYLMNREELAKQLKVLEKPLEDLYTRIDLCAGNESVLGFIKDLSHHFSKGISGFADGFLNFISNPFSSNNPLPQFKDFDKYKTKAIGFYNSDKKAGELGKKLSTRVAYMSSCNASLLEITNALMEVNVNAQVLVKKGLKELDLYISNAITDPSFRTNPKPLKVPQDIKDLEKQTQKIQDINARLIDPTSLEDNVPLATALPNLQELRDVVNNLNTFKNNLDVKDLSSVDELVKSISIKAQNLAELCRDERKQQSCSKQFVKDIKLLLEICANGVTYLATYYYLATQAVQCFKMVIETLDK